MNNTEVAKSFYQGFQKRDYNQMIQLYHQDLSFSDPVFKTLNFHKTINMWEMLCLRAKDFELEFKILKDSGEKVKINWIAQYTYVKTGRKVTNNVIANMTIRDGKIVNHSDDFSLWKWSQMALGPVGYVLGWSPIIKNKIFTMAHQQLNEFISKKN